MKHLQIDENTDTWTYIYYVDVKVLEVSEILSIEELINNTSLHYL